MRLLLSAIFIALALQGCGDKPAEITAPVSAPVAEKPAVAPQVAVPVAATKPVQAVKPVQPVPAYQPPVLVLKSSLTRGPTPAPAILPMQEPQRVVPPPYNPAEPQWGSVRMYDAQGRPQRRLIAEPYTGHRATRPRGP